MSRSTLAEALHRAERRLAHRPADAPASEAAALLCHCLGQPRSHLYAWPERRLSPKEEQRYLFLVERRHEGEPLAHILGHREFWSLDLLVTADTLIPRPETEILVEQALQRLPVDLPTAVLDLGTGSGAVAAAIGSERPLCTLSASDLCAAALAVAEINFRRLGLRNILTFQGSWYRPLPHRSRFHVIVSNPPYIADGDPHLGQGDLPREPRGALAGGLDGLDAIRAIVREAKRYLRPRGWLLVEHGCDQGQAVRALMSGAGLREVQTYPDLAGRERVTAARAGS